MIVLGDKGVPVASQSAGRDIDVSCRLEDLIVYYRDKPAAFVWDVIRAVPDPQQIDILNAIAQPGAHVSVRSGHSTGKTAVESWVVIWFLSCFQDCRIPCTASSGHQLFDILWAEIAKWRGQMNTAFGQALLQKHDKLEIKGAEQQRFAVARTSRRDQPESLQGFHAPNLLFIVDEACFDNQTDVLTDQGWKRFSDLVGSERMLTMNPETMSCEYRLPTKYTRVRFDGHLFAYSHRTIDFAITPNHRLLFKRQTSDGKYGTSTLKWDSRKVSEITSNSFHIPRMLKNNASDVAAFVFPDLVDRYGRKLPDVSVDMDVWVDFLGWYLSEGSLARRHGKAYSVVLSQHSQKGREKIVQVVERLGFQFSVFKHSICVNSWRLCSIVEKYGSGFNGKRVPRYVMGLSPRQIRIFLDSYLAGDGYIKRGCRIIYTSSCLLADDLQELIILSGEYASVHKRKLMGVRSWIHDHYATSSCDGYVVAEYKQKSYAKVVRSRMSRPEYHGDVFCVTVPPYHLLYVRRNGKCHWSGNSGIDDVVFETADGALASEGARILMASNPTRAEGYFFKSHTKDRASWTCLHLSSERSRFVDKKWAVDMAAKYGKDSNVYRVRVLGEFPTQSDDTLIPIDWVTSAVGRDIEVQPAFRRIAGLDVARFGDDANGFIVRQGQVITRIDEWSHCDLMVTCGRVAKAYRDDKAFDTVYVDVIGLGSGVVDRLREMGIPAFGVNVSESPSGSVAERFVRLRDQLWWAVRDFFDAHGCRIEPGLALAERLVAECSGVRYTLTSSGKTVIESKDDMKKRGISSPNLADALCLTFSPGQDVAMVHSRAQSRKVVTAPSGGWA